MTKDLKALTPVEIDTELARIWGEIAATTDRLERTERYLASARSGVAKGHTWEARDVERHEANIATLATKLADLRTEAAPFDNEFYRRGTWLRYFLVTNGNGHVHREMTCHTCYPTTRYAWLVDLADCDEGAMVEEWGERACTVCFPDAPVNPFYHRPAKVDREAREAREAEKRAKDEAKRKKAEAAEERKAKAEAKAVRVAEEKAAGTYKLTPKDKRAAAAEAISKAFYGPAFGNYGEARVTDWDALLVACEEALAAGRADGWKRAVNRIAKAAEAKDETWMTQMLINLSWEI